MAASSGSYKLFVFSALQDLANTGLILCFTLRYGRTLELLLNSKVGTTIKRIEFHIGTQFNGRTLNLWRLSIERNWIAWNGGNYS